MGMKQGAELMTSIAIVGAGYMAAEHAKAFSGHPDVRIAGVVGRSASRAQALASEFGAPVFSDIATLWREARPDVVVVAVNELSMAAVCEQVFQYPWKILLEKPVGVDFTDALRIQRSAEAAGASERTWVALNRRTYSSTLGALERLSAEGARLVTVLDQQDMDSVRALGTPELVVQNYMYANSIHLIDYFQVFCRGDVEAVEIGAPWTPEAPGHVVATLRFTSGDIGVYQATWNGPGPWAVSVASAEARFEMRPLETLTVQLRGERRVLAVERGPLDESYKPGLYLQAGEMLGAAAGRTPGLASLADAVRAMSLCARIYGLA